MKLIILLMLLLAISCSDKPETNTRTTDHDANVDVGNIDVGTDTDGELPDSQTPDTDLADTPDNQQSCTCTTTDDCCDGCHALEGPCDDGRECTLGTRCQPDGTCGGATRSPCDELLEHDQCQAASCDDVAGCTITNTREGLTCELDGIFDGRCQAGACVGTPCECDAESECCDGCRPTNEGDLCGGVLYGQACNGGACVDAPCDCDDASNRCCDGCYWTEGELCTTRAGRECVEFDICGGEYELRRCERYCQAADAYECTALNNVCETTVETCPANTVCRDGSTATGQCYNSAEC